MEINIQTKKIIYNFIENFITALKSKEPSQLENYEIDSELYKEILDIISDYYDDINDIELPDINLISRGEVEKLPLSIFSMDDKSIIGLECELWLDGKHQRQYYMLK